LEEKEETEEGRRRELEARYGELQFEVNAFYKCAIYEFTYFIGLHVTLLLIQLYVFPRLDVRSPSAIVKPEIKLIR
jgi:uncharacterized membrane protein